MSATRGCVCLCVSRQARQVSGRQGKSARRHPVRLCVLPVTLRTATSSKSPTPMHRTSAAALHAMLERSVAFCSTDRMQPHSLAVLHPPGLFWHSARETHAQRKHGIAIPWQLQAHTSHCHFVFSICTSSCLHDAADIASIESHLLSVSPAPYPMQCGRQRCSDRHQ